jgi:hypothetical protein
MGVVLARFIMRPLLLHRLLDDNRELFVPELNEVVRPHPHFMLFATQVGWSSSATSEVVRSQANLRCGFCYTLLSASEERVCHEWGVSLQKSLAQHMLPHLFVCPCAQNPPGAYAGRKALSRAFRSRFLELHVEELPDTELSTILEKR